ncbi:MAG: hypothetical protein CW335_06335 [Clostridiales bacterium]|nr:hypothetical protein [Clostridiales bacterium]
MNRLIAYLIGEARISVTGASPQSVLNRLTEDGIPFWAVERTDEVHYRISIPMRNTKQAMKAATRCFCSAEIVKNRGLPVLWRKILRRPVLLIGMAAAIVVCFLLQNKIWVIEVKGNERVPQEVILRELAQIGIKPGENSGDYDPQQVKMKMLNAVPELSWMAANRTGGKITVLVTERSDPQEDCKKPIAGNLIAASDGIITDYCISEGMRLCNRGDTVSEGQILVSGYEDYGLCMRAVCAEGEIYAKTWHQGSIVTPTVTMQKEYTGRLWEDKTLLIGRKRIKLYGNSGISVDSCDKMINVKRLCLPGYEFPVALETAVFREYTLTARQKIPETVQSELEQAWERQVSSDMIAGTMEQTQYQFSHDEQVFVLQAESACNEMIARLVPIGGQYKGEENDGTDYQRRTD